MNGKLLNERKTSFPSRDVHVGARCCCCSSCDRRRCGLIKINLCGLPTSLSPLSHITTISNYSPPSHRLFLLLPICLVLCLLLPRDQRVNSQYPIIICAAAVEREIVFITISTDRPIREAGRKYLYFFCMNCSVWRPILGTDICPSAPMLLLHNATVAPRLTSYGPSDRRSCFEPNHSPRSLIINLSQQQHQQVSIITASSTTTNSTITPTTRTTLSMPQHNSRISDVTTLLFR